MLGRLPQGVPEGAGGHGRVRQVRPRAVRGDATCPGGIRRTTPRHGLQQRRTARAGLQGQVLFRNR